MAKLDHFLALYRAHDRLERRINCMALDLTKLQEADGAVKAAVQSLHDQLTAANAKVTDLQAKLAANPGTDPADQAAIDAVAADLQGATAISAPLTVGQIPPPNPVPPVAPTAETAVPGAAKADDGTWTPGSVDPLPATATTTAPAPSAPAPSAPAPDAPAPSAPAPDAPAPSAPAPVVGAPAPGAPAPAASTTDPVPGPGADTAKSAVPQPSPAPATGQPGA